LQGKMVLSQFSLSEIGDHGVNVDGYGEIDKAIKNNKYKA